MTKPNEQAPYAHGCQAIAEAARMEAIFQYIEKRFAVNALDDIAAMEAENLALRTRVENDAKQIEQWKLCYQACREFIVNLRSWEGFRCDTFEKVDDSNLKRLADWLRMHDKENPFEAEFVLTDELERVTKERDTLLAAARIARNVNDMGRKFYRFERKVIDDAIAQVEAGE